MLELEHVTFRYPGREPKTALKDITLKFEEGLFYAIFGSSGAGKTTMLTLLGGLDQPTEGSIMLDGKPVAEMKGDWLRKNEVSYIFQDYKLFPYMTAMENVLVACHISKPKLSRDKARALAMETLKQLDLEEDEIMRKVSKLSGGQKQRVAIARALVTDSRYILADEPTGNLDDENTGIIIRILRELVEKYNKCVIVVTHSEKVKNAADVCYHIADGKFCGMV